MMIDYSIIKTKSSIKKIEKSCKILVKVLKKISSGICDGLPVEEIEKITIDIIKSNNAKSGFKFYKGFPYATCVSVNKEIVHGFPIDKILCKGDYITVDSGVLLDGYNSDSAITKIVGGQDTKLIKATKNCLKKGIEQAVHNNKIGDISNAIEKEAHRNGFEIIEEFVGHGIGAQLHEPPQICNFGEANTGYLLKSGMVICIEPILTEKNNKIKYSPNKWTVIGNKNSAHFEHVILINGNKPVILSRW